MPNLESWEWGLKIFGGDMSNYISHSPAASLCPFNAFKSVTTPPHSACTLLAQLASIHDVLRSYVTSTLLASPCDDAVRYCKAVAASCVSQKSRRTMVYSRIVKCQISYLHRNRDTKHLRNDVRTIIIISISRQCRHCMD